MKTSKKIVIVLLTALVVTLCAAIFVACNKIPAHEHEWEVVQKIEAVSCTEPGEIISKCKVCGIENREPDIMPHKISKPDLDKIIPATCTKPGSRAGKCDMCGEDVKIETPALGHDFTGITEVVSEASCETQGETHIPCRRKNCDGGEDGQPAIQVKKSPALGHDWQTWKTVDQKPTYEQTGKRSVHCSRCEKTKDDEVLPRLVAGSPSTYSLRVARYNYEPLRAGLDKVKLTVKDSEGRQVAVSDNHNFDQATATLTVQLEPATYTVTIEGLPEGYTSESSYTVEAGDVYKDLVVHASLLPEEQATDQTRYDLGSVMHDYTFTDVYGRTRKLSDLLKDKDIVLLNFFFVTCGACQSEMPGLVDAYNIYKDNMAVVMLDCVPYDTNNGIISNFLQPFKVPMDWVVAQDITPNDPDPNINYTNICEKFHSTSAPQNIIIDKEGVVIFWEIGSTSGTKFRDTFKKYTSAPYKKSEPATPVQESKAALVDFDIPSKDGDSRKEEQ